MQRHHLVPEDAQGCRLPSAETPHARAARGETFSLEVTLPAVDGSRRWYEANGQPLHNGGAGHAVVVVGGFVSLAATARALGLSALIVLLMLRSIVVVAGADVRTVWYKVDEDSEAAEASATAWCALAGESA